MGAKINLTLILLAVVAIVASMCTFIVDEREQALILQFGNHKGVEQKAGLHFKLPWQTIERFDKRLLVLDAAPNEVITKDKKSILVDNYSRWRIIDPLQVYQVARSQAGVASRMEDVIRGKMREVLGQHTLHEIVSGGEEANLRTDLILAITEKANASVGDLGIAIEDVRIKRADLPEENSEAVFQRMKAERQRIAKEYRSQGEEAAREIRARADKDVKLLVADAYKRAESLRGEGEAEANGIYVSAHKKDPKFYAFVRSLEAYRESIGEGTQVVISPKSEFFHFFEGVK